MKAIALLAALCLVSLPNIALAAPNTKIDPATYLCAEYITEEAIMEGQPPLFEGLQIDGYASAEVGMDVASPDTVKVLLGQTYLWCQQRPTDKVLTAWKQARATGPVPIGEWNAKTSKCSDYALAPDDATGFIIWLDAYNRKLSNTDKSILESDEKIQSYIDACMLNPNKTMLEVLQETLK